MSQDQPIAVSGRSRGDEERLGVAEALQAVFGLSDPNEGKHVQVSSNRDPHEGHVTPSG